MKNSKNQKSKLVKVSTKLDGRKALRPKARVSDEMDEEQVETESEAEETTPKLTAEQNKALATWEGKLAQSEKNYVTIGEALSAILDDELYKSTHKSFDRYCEDKWDISGSHARRFTKAWSLVKALREQNILDAELPRNEAQARILVENVTEKSWVKTWKKLLATVDGNAADLTSALVWEGVKKKRSQTKNKRVGADVTSEPAEKVEKALELITAVKEKKLETVEDFEEFLEKMEEILKGE